ncbi:MAG TPA: hypothetical protein VM076_20005 [Gemmatimonadaceae bacterium]|nr:hypothetical protein [Gemmatimonadaceae bacterium]
MSRVTEDTGRGLHDDASLWCRAPVGQRRFMTLGSWLIGLVVAATQLRAQVMATTRTPGGRFVYVDHHVNPSAGRLVVVTSRRKAVTELPGWLLGIVGDDIAVYHRNQVHFAATRPAEVWTYDPTTGRDARLYPDKPEEIDSRLRDLVVTDRVRRTVEFRFERGADDDSASAAPRSLVVRCERVGTPRQRCAERGGR